MPRSQLHGIVGRKPKSLGLIILFCTVPAYAKSINFVLRVQSSFKYRDVHKIIPYLTDAIFMIGPRLLYVLFKLWRAAGNSKSHRAKGATAGEKKMKAKKKRVWLTYEQKHALCVHHEAHPQASLQMLCAWVMTESQLPCSLVPQTLAYTLRHTERYATLDASWKVSHKARAP